MSVVLCPHTSCQAICTLLKACWLPVPCVQHICGLEAHNSSMNRILSSCQCTIGPTVSLWLDNMVPEIIPHMSLAPLWGFALRCSIWVIALESKFQWTQSYHAYYATTCLAMQGVGIRWQTTIGTLEVNLCQVLAQQQHDRPKIGFQFGVTPPL